MEVTLHLRMGQVMPDCATFGKHGLLTLDCTSPTQASHIRFWFFLVLLSKVRPCVVSLWRV